MRSRRNGAIRAACVRRPSSAFSVRCRATSAAWPEVWQCGAGEATHAAGAKEHAHCAQPAGEFAALAVQQLSGQIVAGEQAGLSSRFEAGAETTLRAKVPATGVGGTATRYNSESGVGTTPVVTMALILVLIPNRRRETLGINQNGRHAVKAS